MSTSHSLLESERGSGGCEEVAPIRIVASLPYEGCTSIERCTSSRVATIMISFTPSGTNEGNEMEQKFPKG